MRADRLELPSDDEIDSRTAQLLSELPPLNVARMLARTGIAPEFFACLSKMFASEWFPDEDREVLLFRTCFNNGSTYEVPQHRAFGVLPTSTIDSILGDSLAGLDPWQRTLCRMADEMARDAKLSRKSVAELVDHYHGQNNAARAIFIMAWFNMLTRFVDSTGVPVEEGPNPFGGIAGPTTRTSP